MNINNNNNINKSLFLKRIALRALKNLELKSDNDRSSDIITMMTADAEEFKSKNKKLSKELKDLNNQIWMEVTSMSMIWKRKTLN